MSRDGMSRDGMSKDSRCARNTESGCKSYGFSRVLRLKVYYHFEKLNSQYFIISIVM